MPLKVTDRVHLAPLGWEVSRIVDPAETLKADKLVLLAPEDEACVADFGGDLVEELAANDRPDLETRLADMHDLNRLLQVITVTIKDHETDDVYINVSTGTKLAAIAGMMAAQTTDATPFYVQPHSEEGDRIELQVPEEPLFPAAGEVSELPVFQRWEPSEEQYRLMDYLGGRDGVTKKEVIHYAESARLPFVENTEAKSDEARYRLLDSHIVEPLTERGYITVEKRGRKREIHLEERGRKALAAFPEGGYTG